MNPFTFIKTQISILDVINEYSPLKKAGLYWKGHCPFHNEKTASFTVSPHKEIFYCFGCSRGGDVVAFISAVENCTALEAVHHLAERYGITIPESILKNTTEPKTEEKKKYTDICHHFLLWSHAHLKKSSEAIRYLSGRGFTQESVNSFSLGYFPGGFESIKKLTADMQRHGILTNDLIEAGLLTAKNAQLFSPFQERIIFPIKDHLGRVCGFGGRIFKEHDQRAKYYNSRENSYFTKGSLLFGFDTAKKSIQEHKSAFLVEGYTDCIAMVQSGYPNTVATLGTACTHEHLKLLARYAEKLYLLYDGDKAGKQAMLRLTQLCWDVKIDLYVVELPPDEDPASFLQKQPSLKENVATAKDIFDFFLTSLTHNFASLTLQEKLAALKTLLETIGKVESALTQDILIKKASALIGIPFESLKQEMMHSYPKRSVYRPESPSTPNLNAQEEEPPVAQNLPITLLEKQLFCAIINDMTLLNEENGDYLSTYLPGQLKAFLTTLRTLKKTTDSFEFVHFFDTLDKKEQVYISKLLIECENSADATNFETLMIQFQKKNWKNIIHDLKQKIEVAKLNKDEKKVQMLLQEFIDLKKKLIQINAF